MVLAMSGGVVFVKDEETVLRLAGSDGKEAANELQEPDAAMAAEAKVAVATVVIVAMEDNRRSKLQRCVIQFVGNCERSVVLLEE